MNNWVAPLREKAQKLAESLIPEINIEELVGSLPYLDKVQRGQRRDESSLRKILSLVKQNLVAQPSPADEAFLFQQDTLSRRLYYQYAPTELFSEKELLSLLKQDTDSFNKLIISRMLLERECLTENTLTQLLNFPISTVRSESIKKRLKSDANWEGLKGYLFDETRSIREYARFYLQRQGITDLINLYKNELYRNPSVGALLGLGEVGRSEQVPLVASFLQNSPIALTRAAITSLGRLKGSEDSGLFYHYLLDENNSLAKAAFEIIKQQYIRYDCQQCYKNILSTPYEHTRRYLCRLIIMGTHWDQLPYLIKLSYSVEPMVREMALSTLSVWGPGYTVPTQEEVDRAKEAFKNHRLSKS